MPQQVQEPDPRAVLAQVRRDLGQEPDPAEVLRAVREELTPTAAAIEVPIPRSRVPEGPSAPPIRTAEPDMTATRLPRSDRDVVGELLAERPRASIRAGDQVGPMERHYTEVQRRAAERASGYTGGAISSAATFEGLVNAALPGRPGTRIAETLRRGPGYIEEQEENRQAAARVGEHPSLVEEGLHLAGALPGFTGAGAVGRPIARALPLMAEASQATRAVSRLGQNLPGASGSVARAALNIPEKALHLAPDLVASEMARAPEGASPEDLAVRGVQGAAAAPVVAATFAPLGILSDALLAAPGLLASARLRRARPAPAIQEGAPAGRSAVEPEARPPADEPAPNRGGDQSPPAADVSTRLPDLPARTVGMGLELQGQRATVREWAERDGHPEAEANWLADALVKTAETPERLAQEYQSLRGWLTMSKAGEQQPHPQIGAMPESPPAGTVMRMRTADILRDPERFQFKETGPEGVTRELKGVRVWDDLSAGVLSIWRDPGNRKWYVVNGHHRHELAERLGQPELNVQVIEAGSAREARGVGALINMREGRGTAIDVAKFLRDYQTTPADLEARGVSLRGDLVREGLALSRLAPDVFDQVATGKIPRGWAVAVGELELAVEQQRDVLKLARESGKRLTEAEVRELARQVRDAQSEDVNQSTLFGEETDRRGLFIPKAQLVAALRRRLTEDRRLFGYVTRQGRADELTRAGETKIDVDAARQLAEYSAQVEELFDRLYTRSGPIAELVTEGARRISRGEKTGAIAAELYPAIGDAVAGEVARAGSGAGPNLPERGGVGEGGSPAAGGAAELAEGRVPDSIDPAQNAMFSPRRPVGRPAPPPLELTSEPVGPVQGSLLGSREGTPAARNLSQTEAAARSELEALRERHRIEQDPARRAQLAADIAQRQKLVNRGQAISAEELATRAEAEPAETIPTGPDQIALLSPSKPKGLLDRLRRVVSNAPPEAEVKALIDISRKLAEAIALPLRQGRDPQLGPKGGALGIFKPKEEVARTRRFDMLDTVAHEAGHFVSQKYFRNPANPRDQWRRRHGPPAFQLTRPMARELVQMGRNLYGTRKAQAGYGEEGIAEWFSFYVTEPARLKQEAPAFTALMDQVLAREPVLKKAFDQARVDFEAYLQADAAQRYDAMMSVNEQVRQMPTVRSLVTSVLDDLHEFKVAMKELGGTADPARDAYVLARLTRGSAGRAEEMLERGVAHWAPDQSGVEQLQRIGPSPLEALRTIQPQRMQAFRRYLQAESDLERMENGIDPGMAKSDAQAIASQGRAEFNKAAEVLWRHYNALITLRERAGMLTAEEAGRITAKNQRHVALYRVFEAEEQPASGGGFGRGFQRAFSGVKRQRGSARRRIDPIEGLIRDTYETVAQVNRFQVQRLLVERARAAEGGGKIAEQVPPPQELVKVPLVKIQEQLSQLGLVVEGVDAKTGQRFTAPIDQLTAQSAGLRVAFFRDQIFAGAREKKDFVVPYLEADGSRTWWQLKDRRFYDAMMGMQDDPAWPLVARWLLEKPAKGLRAGATLTFEFMGRNPGRDAWTSSIYSQAGFRPPFWRLAEGMFHALKQDAVYQRWKLGGGDNAAMLGLDRTTTQRAMAKLFLLSRKGFLKYPAFVVRHPIDALRIVSNAAENATRLGEFAAVERQAAARGAKPRSAATEAALAARDVSIDFGRGGTLAKSVNRIVAFFNANLQGTNKLVHELRTRPGTVIPRAVASITLPSLVLYEMQKDDPAYQEVPGWVRNISWVWVQRSDDQGEGWDGYGSGKVERVWMFPKPFELGILFGTVPERIMEWIDENDPAAGRQMALALRKAFTPPYLPTALTPLIENWANKSTFTDRPIVPRGRENLDPAEQVKPQTSQVARIAGRAVGYSPAKIDNLVRGYTGGLGAYATGGADWLLEQLGMAPSGERRATERGNDDRLSRLPGVRAFARPAPAEDAEAIERVYRAFEQAERRRQTWKQYVEDGQMDRAAAYFQQHRDEIMAVATAEDTGGDPGPLRQQMAQVREVQQALREARLTGDRDLVDRIRGRMPNLVAGPRP